MLKSKLNNRSKVFDFYLQRRDVAKTGTKHIDSWLVVL